MKNTTSWVSLLLEEVMPTIHVESEQLLKAVEQLPPHELDTFVAQVLAVRAQREAPTLSTAESTLLLTINSAIPESLQQRYDELTVQRQAEQLTPTEQVELLQLTNEIEQREADRVAALADLSRLRGIPPTHLLQTLGTLSEFFRQSPLVDAEIDLTRDTSA